MNQQIQTIDNKTGEVVANTFRAEFKRLEGEIGSALPPHIPVERFMRVVLTAVNMNPDLVKADRQSLLGSCLKAAQDGLLPDGRDGALVIFNTKQKINGRDTWIEKVQWMPMIGGILKKVRNSGDLLSISAYVVYEKDKFYYRLGDDEKIEHEPCIDGPAGNARLVYAIAKTKDGGIYREVMTIAQVEKVRAVSKAGKSEYGPWAQWWDEMAKKTVLKRLAKRLPTSADLDDLLRRDDDLYDFKGARDKDDAPSTFVPVANPLRDQPALQGGGSDAIENLAANTDRRNPDDLFQGDTSKMAAADLVISRSGKILKDRDGLRPEAIVDQRFDLGDDGQGDVFVSFHEWIKTCGESDLKTDFGLNWPEPDVTGGAGRDGETDHDSDAQEEPAEETAGNVAPSAAARQPAQETNAPSKPAASRKAEKRAFESDDEYVNHMNDVFDRATSKAAINEAWASTRDDRRELLGVEQIDALTTQRDAALKRLATKGAV